MIYTKTNRIPDWVYAQPEALVPSGISGRNVFGLLAGDIKRKYGGVFFEINEEAAAARLLYIYVKPGRRGEGIALRLLMEAQKQLSDMGVAGIFTEIPVEDEVMPVLLRYAGLEEEGGFHRRVFYDRDTLLERGEELKLFDEEAQKLFSDIHMLEKDIDAAGDEGESIMLQLISRQCPVFYGGQSFNLVEYKADRVMGALSGRIEGDTLLVDAVTVDESDASVYGLFILYLTAGFLKNNEGINRIGFMFENYWQSQMLEKTYGIGKEEPAGVVYVKKAD